MAATPDRSFYDSLIDEYEALQSELDLLGREFDRITDKLAVFLAGLMKELTTLSGLLSQLEWKVAAFEMKLDANPMISDSQLEKVVSLRDELCNVRSVVDAAKWTLNKVFGEEA